MKRASVTSYHVKPVSSRFQSLALLLIGALMFCLVATGCSGFSLADLAGGTTGTGHGSSMAPGDGWAGGTTGTGLQWNDKNEACKRDPNACTK